MVSTANINYDRVYRQSRAFLSNKEFMVNYNKKC
jgi:hypothetical protein